METSSWGDVSGLMRLEDDGGLMPERVPAAVGSDEQPRPTTVSDAYIDQCMAARGYLPR
jgi:hypothetical protein